ncbi:hypothetical protein BD769DRAFT_1553150 [Suillus cothurnatus]|nr:hypothetical protein BD769DRAFT_1553150 [Suillus cothurnatus]
MASAMSTPVSSSDLPPPDNAPTVGNVFPVNFIALLFTFAISTPWWRGFLPNFYCCGCLPCILVPDKEEEDASGTVDLRFARVVDAIGVSEAPSVVTTSRMRPVPNDDKSFWCGEDDELSWLVDGASASDDIGPSHPLGETLPANTSAPSDSRVMDLEFQAHEHLRHASFY